MVSQWSIYRNEKYFAQPTTFIPERWLGDPRFENDDRSALQPFSFGPRNCIGRKSVLPNLSCRSILLTINSQPGLLRDACHSRQSHLELRPQGGRRQHQLDGAEALRIVEEGAFERPSDTKED